MPVSFGLLGPSNSSPTISCSSSLLIISDFSPINGINPSNAGEGSEEIKDSLQHSAVAELITLESIIGTVGSDVPTRTRFDDIGKNMFLIASSLLLRVRKGDANLF